MQIASGCLVTSRDFEVLNVALLSTPPICKHFVLFIHNEVSIHPNFKRFVLRADIWDPVRADIWDPVRADIWDDLRNDIWDPFRDDIWDPFPANIWDLQDYIWDVLNECYLFHCI